MSAVEPMRALAVLLCALAVVAPPALAREAGGARDARGDALPQEPAQQPPAEPAPGADADPESSSELPVARVLVEGEERWREEDLVAALAIEVGRPYDGEAVRRGLERLWSAFRVRGTVSLREVADGAEPALELRLQVVESPVDLEPRFIGHAGVSEAKVREWARLPEQSELYLTDVAAVARRLERAYREEGYAFARVLPVTRPGGTDETGREQAPDVIFEIHEGPKVKVADLVIHGAQHFQSSGALWWSSGLSDVADAKYDPPLLWFMKKAFVQEDLDADLLAMRQVYRDRGWLDAVVELERLEWSHDRSRVTIHVAVDEGPLYTVASLDVIAVEPEAAAGERRAELRPVELLFPKEELLALCQLAPGQPYALREARRDERALRDYYGERGHIQHPSLPSGQSWSFEEPELLYDVARRRVHVTYRLVQGQQQFVREVVVRGNTHTQDRVVRRLITVEPGDVANLKEIRSSLNRVRGSGFFSDARDPLRHREPTYDFVPTDDPKWKDLEFLLEDGGTQDYGLSVAYGEVIGPAFQARMTLRNFDILDWPSSFGSTFEEVGSYRAFHGAGQTLDLNLLLGTRQSNYSVRFTEPDVFGLHEDRVSASLEATRFLFRRALYDIDRESYGLELGRMVGPDSTVFGGWTYQRIDVSDIETGGEPVLGDPLAVPQLLKDEEGEHELSYLQLGYRRRRLDSFIDPREGESFRVGTQAYVDGLASDASFVKSTLIWDVYGRFGDEDDASRPGWKVGLDVGVAVPFGATEDVPYTERFFLGGLKTLRGFRSFGVGPNEKGDAIGGETMAALSLEYRHPLLEVTPPGDTETVELLRMSPFVDVGVLDPDALELDLSEYRASAGVAFSLSYPLPFPLAFVFGVPLVEGEDDDTRFFQFALGNL